MFLLESHTIIILFATLRLDKFTSQRFLGIAASIDKINDHTGLIDFV